MTTFWPFELSPGWEPIADVIVLTWLGGAFVFVAWSKQWMAKPSYNTACSMISIIIFIVVVKEGGLQVLLTIAGHVGVGALISNLVCLALWPQSATAQLQSNMTKTLSSFSTILDLLTNAFLLNPEGVTNADPAILSRALEAHQSSFTSLKRNLGEARTEWLLDARMRDADISRAYDDAVDSMNRLAQHLGGLRSGIAQQNEFNVKGLDGNATPANEAKAAMFAELVDDLGPPLTALSSACREALSHMEGSFRQRPSENHDEAASATAAEFERVTALLERALFAFDSTSNHAIMRVYRRSALVSEVSSFRHGVHGNGKAADRRPQADAELYGIDGLELGNAGQAAGEESVFLVYWFVFTLQEFGRELVTLGTSMQRVKAREDALARQSGWKIFRWLKRPDDFIAPARRPGFRRRVCEYIIFRCL